MIIAITGHRPDKVVESLEDLELAYRQTFIEAEPDAVIVGMAAGCDLIAGLAAIDAGFDVWAVVPWVGQAMSKYNTMPEEYDYVLANAAKIIVLNDSEAKTQPDRAFQNRNEWMVDNATHLLAYFDGSPSGTKNCIDYAVGKIPVRNMYGQILPV